MIIRARAPLRLGLAGGGTDVSPYTEMFGGAVMNATIGHYAYAKLKPREDGRVAFHALDLGAAEELPAEAPLPLEGRLSLLRAVYNRIVADHHGGRPLPVTLTSYSEAPAGSGLGSSSALVVACVQAFAEWLSLPLGEYDVAHLAYVIERVDLGQQGGRQDQYAATFGGFNFMEFGAEDRVIVNPLRIRPEVVKELEARTLLCFTGVSRESAHIIAQQSDQVKAGSARSIEAMHALKASALVMKEALLRGDFALLAETLRQGWAHKRATAEGVSNTHIEQVQQAALDAGAYAGKVSGAGGGGFMMLMAPMERRPAIAARLEAMGCRVEGVSFVPEGATAWRCAGEG